MIESLYIKNFLSFKEEQEISFIASNKEKGQDPEMSEFWYKEVSSNKKLLKLLFFVGENGAGKTNVLKAINYIREVAIRQKTDRRDNFQYCPFKLDDTSCNSPSEIKLTYYIDSDCYSYNIVVGADCIISEELKKVAGRSTSRVFLRTTDNETGAVSISFGTACDLQKATQKELVNSTISSCSVLASFWSLNIESKVLSQNYEYFRDRISLVHNSKEKTLADKLYEYKDDARMRKLVLQLLKDLTTNIVDYEVIESVISFLDDPNIQNEPSFKELMLKRYPEGKIFHRILRFAHSTSHGQYQLDVDEESLGTIDIIRLMIVVYDIIISKKASFIDEVERGIHTKALQFIIKAFLLLSNESQIIVTTHDLKLLDMSFMRRDSVRKVVKNNDGVSIIELINQNLLHRNSSLMNRVFADVLSEMPDLFKDDDLLSIYKDILNKEE
jgi:AAA15 family ATPase/GTPase